MPACRTPTNAIPLRLAWLFVALFVVGASPARAWWNDGWTLRKKITLDATGTGVAMPDPIGPAPVLVRLHDGDFQVRQRAARGDGFAFCRGRRQDAAPLSHREIRLAPERGVRLGEASRASSRAPRPASGSTTATRAARRRRSRDAKDTYDAGHGRSSIISTSRASRPLISRARATTRRTTGPRPRARRSAPGLRLDGTDPVTIPGSAVLAWADGGTMTWSAWVKFGAPQPNAVFFGRKDGGRIC